MPRTPNAKFMAPVQPDAALAALVGAAPLPRSEIVKKLWAHIHEHGLQDLKDGRVIHCDGALKAICDGRAQITMFELSKCWNKHVTAAAA